MTPYIPRYIKQNDKRILHERKHKEKYLWILVLLFGLLIVRGEKDKGTACNGEIENAQYHINSIK